MKSKVVQEVEHTYRALDLEFIKSETVIDEIEKTDWEGTERTYVIPAEVHYLFSYTWNGKSRQVQVVRKNGNSHPLSSNIRVEIVKQLAEELKEMEGIKITKGEK